MPIATCHCGATRIRVERLPETATLCNCTFCAKRGALWGYYDPAEVRVEVAGADAVYAPHRNKHHFCPTCGCGTYTLTPNWRAHLYEGAEMRDDAQMSVNLRLLDDVDVDALPVERIDGRTGWG